MKTGKNRDCECIRCGACCLPGIYSLMKDDDIERWKREGRRDILDVILHQEPVWAGDHIISARGHDAEKGCPFLVMEGGRCSCAIYDTRPRVCREFAPGSSLLCPRWRGDDR